MVSLPIAEVTVNVPSEANNGRDSRQRSMSNVRIAVGGTKDLIEKFGRSSGAFVIAVDSLARQLGAGTLAMCLSAALQKVA
jgi:hypothetical protein